MTRILHIISSPRGPASESRRLTDAFVDRYTDTHRGTQVDTLDLWAQPLATFGERHVAAKMAVIGGREVHGAAEQVWNEIGRVFERFDAADLYVVGVPMWNGGIPWILKHYIDTLTQPGLLFRFDPATGYHGLLRDKRAVAAYTSAVYHEGAAAPFGRDFHSSYFTDWLHFAGIDEVHEIRLQPTSPTDPDLDRRRHIALERVAALAGGLSAA